MMGAGAGKQTTLAKGKIDAMGRPKAYFAFTIAINNFAFKLLAWLIIKFTGGDVNHACIIAWSPEWNCWQAIGANSNGITIEPLEEFKRTHRIVHMFEASGFSIWDGLRAHAGDLDKSYSYGGLFRMAFVEIRDRMFKRQPNLKHQVSDKRLFCSEWVFEVAHSAIPETLTNAFWAFQSTYAHADEIAPARLCYIMNQLRAFNEVPLTVLD